MVTIKYTPAQVQKLLKEIHSGDINDRNLPPDLYYAIRDYLTSGLIKGFGYSLEDAPKGQEEILQDLYDNVSFFSAAKTFSFIKEAGDLLVDSEGQIKPFNEWRDEAEATYGKYNDTWAQAEYRTTIGSGQAAQQWQTIEASKDVLPYLTFSTAGSPCPECAPFEGVTAPVDDPLWDEATPLLHFMCECLLLQSDDATLSTKEQIDNLPMDDIPDMFRNNPGKTGEIFNSSHPYFNIDAADEEFGKSNFGLPVDKE